MKLIDTISWLMGRVQRSLFPHLNQCLPTPLTEQEERLVAILEIVVSGGVKMLKSGVLKMLGFRSLFSAVSKAFLRRRSEFGA